MECKGNVESILRSLRSWVAEDRHQEPLPCFLMFCPQTLVLSLLSLLLSRVKAYAEFGSCSWGSFSLKRGQGGTGVEQRLCRACSTTVWRLCICAAPFGVWQCAESWAGGSEPQLCVPGSWGRSWGWGWKGSSVANVQATSLPAALLLWLGVCSLLLPAVVHFSSECHLCPLRREATIRNGNFSFKSQVRRVQRECTVVHWPWLAWWKSEICFIRDGVIVTRWSLHQIAGLRRS